jgi:hypothetical protein
VLVGVFFKISTQIVGFVFLSKAQIKSVIIVEILYNFILTFLSILLVKDYGLIGSVIAFCVCNILYFIGVQILFYYKFVTNKALSC